MLHVTQTLVEHPELRAMYRKSLPKLGRLVDLPPPIVESRFVYYTPGDVTPSCRIPKHLPGF